jgi:hypothetical protein
MCIWSLAGLNASTRHSSWDTFQYTDLMNDSDYERLTHTLRNSLTAHQQPAQKRQSFRLEYERGHFDHETFGIAVTLEYPEFNSADFAKLNTVIDTFIGELREMERELDTNPSDDIGTQKSFLEGGYNVHLFSALSLASNFRFIGMGPARHTQIISSKR